MGQLKKQLEEVQDAKPITTAEQLPTTQIAPIPPLQPLQPIPSAEDAIAEEYVEPEHEPESLNLNEHSRQMLQKALDRNNGNRKKAAQELGISDRTLYRKLKLYGME